jgi:hypothetical protein
MYTSIRAKALSRTKIFPSLLKATLRARGLETRARADPRRISFGGAFSTNHQYGHELRAMILLFGHPAAGAVLVIVQT